MPSIFHFFLAVGLAGIAKAHNDLNIPFPKEIAEDNDNYEAYKYFAKYADYNMERENSPCLNFYNYSCQYANISNTALLISKENIAQVVRGIKKERNTEWYRLLRREFDNCLHRRISPEAVHQNGTVLKTILRELAQEFRLPFPFISTTTSHAGLPQQFGDVVGYLAQRFQVHTFLSYKIKNRKLILGEPQLAYPVKYFTMAFDMFGDGYKESITDYITQVLEVLDTEVSRLELAKIVDDVVEFELRLARILEVLPVDDALRNDAAQELVKNAGQSLDLKAYLRRISKNVRQPDVFAALTSKIQVAQPTRLQAMQSFIAGYNPVVILNYLIVRLARGLRQYFPRKPKECLADQWLRDGRGVQNIGTALIPPTPQMDPYPVATMDWREVACAETLNNIYTYLVSRVFIDENLPDLKKRTEFVERIKTITKSVTNALRNQFAKVPWLTPASKEAIFKKLDNMRSALVYDKWMENDEYLDKRYRKKEFADNEDEHSANQRLNNLKQELEWSSLFADETHQYFPIPIITVNAYYEPSSNFFCVPLGILQRHFFDINYPAALQYGIAGFVIAHEISHGFDPHGVRYNYKGEKVELLDSTSKESFNKMVQCVIAQYNRRHHRGEYTQTEDVADNTGIRAAFNAYKAEQGLHGSDPQLPQKPLNHYTQDQLFFNAYAQLQCSSHPTNDLPFESHSSLFDRLHGVMQNMRHFQAAYHCPIGSEYAPEEYCHVWL
ncbi:unnamed protein product [Bursaphelenchus xylophilus]|uniref:(pine wood nematode) hypothetical protein n=1 Tax=Bursaphelenchus xylophilus TaxID=6326 RepID=A0A1I7SAU7_BURXY|nr:unnamed protein product [Bursaphelenchus xylophilus]CAG9126754.1 unnamed protein product [Bursaphelenchus xylophilus]